ncbi:amidohydrolase family protein [Burkholderia sp. Ac-20344]|uniref:amidohydrolase family protein n=1 Tax=Burkholderia sp. Ac-20344 TaxID=2703890 RepID=UPI00197CA36A|nr:amidohydrolase family protein [Burkholderia sp. Ac-20344]MBN3831027.1 amidohydrolase family protein [Burkholderia sp. Ac-20344]
MSDDVLYANIEYFEPETCGRVKADILIGEGVIRDIYPPGEGPRTGNQVIDGAGCLMFPGLVNAHLHPSKELYGDLHDFSPIQVVLDTVHKNNALESEQTQRTSALYSILRNVRAGVTSFGIFTSRFETDAHACEAVGVRASIQFCQSDQWLGTGSKPAAYGIDEILSRYERSVAGYESSRIHLSPATASELSASDDLVRQLHAVAKRSGKKFAMHIHEGPTQVASFREVRGTRALHHLESLGVLDEHATLVHASSVDDSDIEILQRTRANLIHCPISNSFVGAGRMPVRKFLDGQHVGLGTDAAMVNPENRLTNDAMFCLYHHGVHDLTEKPGARDVFRMLTVSGAEAIGLRRLGAIRAGWLADFLIYRRARLSEAYSDTPIGNLRLLRNESPDEVFVGGTKIFADGTFLCCDGDAWQARFATLKEGITA